MTLSVVWLRDNTRIDIIFRVEFKADNKMKLIYFICGLIFSLVRIETCVVASHKQCLSLDTFMCQYKHPFYSSSFRAHHNKNSIISFITFFSSFFLLFFNKIQYEKYSILDTHHDSKLDF